MNFDLCGSNLIVEFAYRFRYFSIEFCRQQNTVHIVAGSVFLIQYLSSSAYYVNTVVKPSVHWCVVGMCIYGCLFEYVFEF